MAGIIACFLFTAWATLTLGAKPVVDLGRFNFPWHDYMIGAIGNVIMIIVGFAASLLPAAWKPARPVPSLTVAAPGASSEPRR